MFSKPPLIDIQVGYFSGKLDRLGGMNITEASEGFREIFQCCSIRTPELYGVLKSAIHIEDRQAFESFLPYAAKRLKPIAWNGRICVGEAIKFIRIDLIPPAIYNPNRIWLGILKDLTDMKQCKDFLENTLDAAQMLAWHYDIRHDQLRLGARWSKFAKHQINKTTFQIDNWLTKVHPEDMPAVRATIQALERGTKEHVVLTYRRKLKDGIWAWQRVRAGIIERANDGTPTALTGVCYEATEEELQGTTEYLGENLSSVAGELTENVPVGLYTMEMGPNAEMANFGFMSRRFLEITGLTEDEARADPLKAFACVHPDDFDDWVKKNAYAFFHKAPFREETRLLVNGEVRWVTAESLPRQTADGTWIWEGVIWDITSEKRSERALRRADKQLLQVERELARMEERERVARDIHDSIGNQLALMMLRLQSGFIKVDELPSIIRGCLRDIRQLINDADFENENLFVALLETMQTIDDYVRPLPITLHWDLGCARELHMPYNYISQIKYVAQEAVSNALRHGEASSIWVNVRKEKAGYFLEIKDNGQGFDLDKTLTSRGLINMRKRAQRNGWRLEVTSNSNGTNVTLFLGNGLEGV